MRHHLGLVLAATLALAGCDMPLPASPIGGAAVSGRAPSVATRADAAKPPAEVGAQAAETAVGRALAGRLAHETAAALSEEREMDDYDRLADEDLSRFSLARAGTAGVALGDEIAAEVTVRLAPELDRRVKAQVKKRLEASGKAGDARARAEVEKAVRAEIAPALERELKAELTARAKARDAGVRAAAKVRLQAETKAKLEARRGALRERLRARLDKLADARGRIKEAFRQAAWVTNTDGSRTKTLIFDVVKTVDGKQSVRKAKLVRTVDAEGLLVAASVDFRQSFPNGLSRVSSRTKVLQADGSYKVVFHAELTLPSGKTRVTDWQKTIAASGAVTGSGTIATETEDGEVTGSLPVELGGSEEAPSAITSDPASEVEAEVAIDPEGEVSAEATAGDESTGVVLAPEADGTIPPVDEEATGTNASANANEKANDKAAAASTGANDNASGKAIGGR